MNERSVLTLEKTDTIELRITIVIGLQERIKVRKCAKIRNRYNREPHLIPMGK